MPLEEKQPNFKVNKGCTIYHKNVCYTEGEEVYLTMKNALVHGLNITPLKVLSHGDQGLALTDYDDDLREEDLP